MTKFTLEKSAVTAAMAASQGTKMTDPDTIEIILSRLDDHDASVIENHIDALETLLVETAEMVNANQELGETFRALYLRALNTLGVPPAASSTEVKAELAKLAQLRNFALTTGKMISTQDGRCTADPLFCVFEKSEVVANDEYDHDRIVWVDAELDNDEVTETKRQRLELLHDDGRDINERYQRLAIKEVDKFVTACLTEQGCKDFLAIQGHNLRKPFTYVTSLFRNEEMKQLRSMMMGAAISAAPSAVNWNDEAKRMAAIMHRDPKQEATNV